MTTACNGSGRSFLYRYIDSGSVRVRALWHMLYGSTWLSWANLTGHTDASTYAQSRELNLSNISVDLKHGCLAQLMMLMRSASGSCTHLWKHRVLPCALLLHTLRCAQMY